MREIEKQVQKIIRKLIIERGLSEREIAQAIGVSQTCLNRVKNRSGRDVPLKIVVGLFEKFDIPLHEVFGYLPSQNQAFKIMRRDMDVKELIQVLQNKNQELRIVVDGYEGGYCDISSIDEISLKLNTNKKWYYGPHDQDKNGETALVIRRIENPR